MTQGVSSPQGSWLTPDWDVEPNVHALSTLRGGGLSAQAYASFNLAQHVGDDPEHVRANRALLRAAAKLPSEPLWLELVHGIHVVEHPGPAALGVVRHVELPLAERDDLSDIVPDQQVLQRARADHARGSSHGHCPHLRPLLPSRAGELDAHRQPIMFRPGGRRNGSGYPISRR